MIQTTNMKEKYREFYATEICRWLLNHDLISMLHRPNGKSLIETSFDHLVRWYPQIDELGRDTYGFTPLERIERLPISERVMDDVITYLNSIVSVSNGDFNEYFKKRIHYEHNAPVDVIKKELLKLDKPDVKSVSSILNNGYDVVILKKEEVIKLASLGLSKKGSYEERLNAIGGSVIGLDEKMELINLIKLKVKH